MKESLIQQFIDVLQKDEIKKECKTLFKPILHFILYEMSPYIYIIILFLFIIFLMILAILILLILLLRNKESFTKIF